MIGFLGGGNMGEAIFSGILNHKLAEGQDLFVADISQERLQYLKERYGVQTGNAKEMLKALQDASERILFLCVKPYQFAKIEEEYAQLFKGIPMISIMAGWTNEKLTVQLPKGAEFLRVMPNACARVGKSMSVLAEENTLSDASYQLAVNLLNACGETCVLPERLFDAATGLSGSGPAYVFLFLEALIMAGVKNGLPWGDARKMAVQTVVGSAEMIMQLKESPHNLCDQVCTPGGTTIDAVHELLSKGFEGAVMDAVTVCTEKSKAMGRK